MTTIIDVSMVISAIVEMGTESARKELNRRESIIRILNKIGINSAPTPDDFDSHYKYALVEFGIFKPEPVLNFFRNEFIQESFIKAYKSNDSNILLNEAENIYQWNLETGELGQLDYDPRQEFLAFSLIFHKLVLNNRSPSEVHQDKEIESIHQKLDVINDQLLSFTNIDDLKDFFKKTITSLEIQTNIFAPLSSDILESLENLNNSEKYSRVYESILHLMHLSLYLFIATVVNYFEDQIINETPELKSKVRDIKKLLQNDFLQPSLFRVLKLADKCYHLTKNNKIPNEIKIILDAFTINWELKNVGQMLDDLEAIFPPSKGNPIKAKSKIKRNFLNFIFQEYISYSNKIKNISSNLEQLNANSRNSEINLQNWIEAYNIILFKLSSIISLIYRYRTLSTYDPGTVTHQVLETKYINNQRLESRFSITEEESDKYEKSLTELVLAKGDALQLFPFLVIHNDAICYYIKSTTMGYQYFSFKNNEKFTISTSKKFSQSVFQIGSKQDWFWSDVIPAKNEANQIKANIPPQQYKNFIGRKNETTTIIEEILQIPNKDGIIFGPGGIGKTALMIEVSKKLYKEENPNKIYFQNIVWISAKSDFYEYKSSVVEVKKPQFQSLEHVLTAILYFFEIGDAGEYSLKEKKELVLELLEANTVLLILDNFETVPLDEVDALLEFFDNKVKKHLRKYPYNFKVIITSRRQMPSGLHQIKLGGLNHNDAMELIENILENYQDSGKEISKAQCEMIIEASAGIPIVIKHLFAMIFEHNKPIGQVIRALSNYKHELIQFSFKELLSAIESQDNKIQLKIIALLEIINMPLMIRQISDILDADEFEIEESIIELTNYLCISRTFTDRHEKYAINAEINHLSKALVLEHPDLTTEIRDNITNNFTIDKTLDYTNEEIMIVGFFTKFIQDENYLEAEDYIKSKINEYPDSNIIKLHYAHYLRKYMNDSRKAIGLYEDLQEKIGSHKSVVQGIFSCHLHDEIPNFEKTHIYARELEKYSDEDEDLKIELGEFYLRWSSTLKEKLGSSTVTERMRQENYKKLAMKAYDIIDTVKKQDHKTYYLLSHCQYNLWDYKRSLRLINKAISLTYRIKREAFHSYFEFRKIIISKMKRHSRRDYDSIQDFHTY